MKIKAEKKKKYVNIFFFQIKVSKVVGSQFSMKIEGHDLLVNFHPSIRSHQTNILSESDSLSDRKHCRSV